MKESLQEQYSDITSVASGYSSHKFLVLLGISAEYKYFINPGLERALHWAQKEHLCQCFSRGTSAINVVACAFTGASEVTEICYVLGLGSFRSLKGI